MNQGLLGYPVPAWLFTPYLNVQDQKAAGTDGGAFTSGADRTRVLNTIVADTGGIASLASNQLTLPAGTYTCQIRAPAYSVGQNVAWLYNVTDAADVLRGQNNFSYTGNVFNLAMILGRFELKASKALEVRHRCVTTNATNGFGVNMNGSFTVPIEIYTVAEFWKVG